MRRRSGRCRRGGSGGGSSPDEWVEGEQGAGPSTSPRTNEPGPHAAGREAPDLARPGHRIPGGTARVAAPRGRLDKPKPEEGISGPLRAPWRGCRPLRNRQNTKAIMINLDRSDGGRALGLGTWRKSLSATVVRDRVARRTRSRSVRKFASATLTSPPATTLLTSRAAARFAEFTEGVHLYEEGPNS